MSRTNISFISTEAMLQDAIQRNTSGVARLESLENEAVSATKTRIKWSLRVIGFTSLIAGLALGFLGSWLIL